MTPHELLDELEKCDKARSEMSLGLAEGLALVLIRPRPPNGHKIRTPFGNCEIMNCQEKDGQYQTVFFATRKQIISYINNAI